MLVAFSGACDAVSCALSGRQAVAAQAGARGPIRPSWRLRAALDTGDVEFNGEQHRGYVVQRVDRLLETVPEGQILCLPRDVAHPTCSIRASEHGQRRVEPYHATRKTNQGSRGGPGSAADVECFVARAVLES